jgi:hypothetical protein
MKNSEKLFSIIHEVESSLLKLKVELLRDDNYDPDKELTVKDWFNKSNKSIDEYEPDYYEEEN